MLALALPALSATTAGAATAAPAARAAAGAPAAVAAIPSCISGYCQLTNYNDGKCLDVTGGSKSHGAAVQQWACNGDRQQYWARFGSQIRNLNSGMCLSIAGNDPNPGGEVTQWDCDFTGSNAWEDWSNASWNIYPWYEYYSAGSCDGTCAMHQSGSGTANGLKIYMNYPNDYSYYWDLH